MVGGKTNALTNGESVEDEGIDEVDGLAGTRNSSASQKSSSDDGGFLSRRSFITARASWRRPLVQSPSQLSLQSVAAGSARGFLQGLGGLLKIGGSLGAADNCGENMNSGARYQNVYGNNLYRNLHHHHQQAQPASKPLHINTISGSVAGHHMHQVFSPSKVSRIFSSSPASTPNDPNLTDGGLLTSPWALTTPNHTASFSYNQFSDLSTVYPGSAERSVPTLTPTASGNLSRYRYYSHELPSLRTIQEETRRLNYEQQQQQQYRQDFLPLQLDSPPSWRSYYQHSQAPYYHSYRPRTRWYPRHYSRLFGRAQSDLMSPLPHLNLSVRTANNHVLGLDASPESRSSSSGFGSKNTSNHPQGSHHSGSTSEWRLLPPYRPPPPPPASVANTSAYFGSSTTLTAQQQQQQQPTPQQAQGQAPVANANQQQHHQFNTLPSSYQPYSPSNYFSSSTQRTLTPPYTMEHWLDMITRLNAATDNVNLPKSVDVGSVDGHYEFDPSTPTPSASTPTGGLLREDLNLHIDTTTGHHLHHHPTHHSNQHHHLHHHNGQHYHHNHAHNHTHHQPQGQHHTLGPLSSSSSSVFHKTPTSASFPPISGSATFGGTPLRKSRVPGRYDNIEARLQAMKEEFYEYRKRQAMQRAGVAELESVC